MKKNIEKYTYYTKEWDEYLSSLENQIKKSAFLPKYHLYPKTGLMNDPNGLCFYNNEYHVFYQWFPFDSFHGMKHWGHAISDDLVAFKGAGIALTPDQDYETHGAYSGNAFEHNGLLYLYYTANYKTENGKIAKQALAIMNREGTINKYEHNPIIDGAPEGFSQELRDPFVFERNNTFYMLLGGGRFDGQERAGFGDTGELLLYQSDDLIHWAYQGVIDLPIERGYMLECPSLVTIDGKDVLFLSPMGYEKERYRYHNRFASIYLIGYLDVEKRTFDVEYMDELDAGFDYYAPQSFYGKDQQALTFGWFGCGEQIYPIDQEGWKHGLTTAQEMSLVNGKLRRFPIKELHDRFSDKEKIRGKNITINKPYYHLTFEVEKKKDLSVVFGALSDYWQLVLDMQKMTLSVDRSKLQQSIDQEYGTVRSIALDDIVDEVMTFDIFVDNSFIEVYINKGEKVFSFRVFLPSNQSQISFSKEVVCQIAYFN